MYTRDEYNAELLMVAHRVAQIQPRSRNTEPLLTAVELAEGSIRQGWAPQDIDAMTDELRVVLLAYIGESELPEAPERA